MDLRLIVDGHGHDKKDTDKLTHLKPSTYTCASPPASPPKENLQGSHKPKGIHIIRATQPLQPLHQTTHNAPHHTYIYSPPMEPNSRSQHNLLATNSTNQAKYPSPPSAKLSNWLLSNEGQTLKQLPMPLNVNPSWRSSIDLSYHSLTLSPTYAPKSASSLSRSQLSQVSERSLSQIAPPTHNIALPEALYDVSMISPVPSPATSSSLHQQPPNPTTPTTPSPAVLWPAVRANKRWKFVNHGVKAPNDTSKPAVSMLAVNEHIIRVDKDQPRDVTAETKEPRSRSYGCQQCKRTFFRKSDLIRHIQIHLGIKPNVCDVCGKQFIQRSALTVHLRVHTGEKPFSCLVCNRAFSDSSSLARHRRIHERNKV